MSDVILELKIELDGLYGEILNRATEWEQKNKHNYGNDEASLIADYILSNPQEKYSHVETPDVYIVDVGEDYTAKIRSLK